LFVVDVAGSEGRNPTEDLRNLRREIDLYDPILSKRPWCIIANKMDLPGARENLEALKNRFSTVEIAALSAQTGEGLEDLRVKLEKWLVNASERHPIDRAQTDRASSGN
jgi:GTP-binding protein